jgi:hypothetical protein
MTISIFDTSPVNLDGTITTGSTLDILHGTQSFAGNGDNLFNELRLLTSAEVTIADFSVGGTTHQVHAWEVVSGGSLSKWSRSGSSSVSGVRTQMNADVIVVAVPPGVSVPDEPEPQGPPAPGTTQKKIKVRVEKADGMPLP